MLVLHGAWGVERTTGDAAFLFWAEDPGGAGNPGVSVPPEPAAEGAARPRAHPCQAAPADVRAALGALATLTRGVSTELHSSAAAWSVRLPTRDDLPLPSATTEPIVDDVRLETWHVRGRAVHSGQAVWLLALLPATAGRLDGEAAPELALGEYAPSSGEGGTPRSEDDPVPSLGKPIASKTAAAPGASLV